MQHETNAEWVTISEAIKSWHAAPGYDRLYRMVKRSGIETRRRGKYRNERFIAHFHFSVALLEELVEYIFN